MKLPFLFKTTETTSSWPWPSCGNPKTISFRASNDTLKTMNSSHEPNAATTDSPELDAAGTGGGKSVEAVIRGLLRSERLFFDPAQTSSISPQILCPQKSLSLDPNAESAATQCDVNLSKHESQETIVWTDSVIKQRDTNFQGQRIALEESVVMEMESEDPLEDFKRSMEEMVEAHGLKKWECLEELLSWYLRANDKSNHGYVVGAFVELLAGLAFASSSSSCSSSFGHEQSSSSSSAHTPTSPLSFSSSSSTTSTSSHCISSLEAEGEIEKT